MRFTVAVTSQLGQQVIILHIKYWCSVSVCGCVGIHELCLCVPFYFFFPPHKATLRIVINGF
jgi:hypothetical protein